MKKLIDVIEDPILYPDYVDEKKEEEKFVCKGCMRKTLQIIKKGNLFDGKCTNCDWDCYNKFLDLYLKEVIKDQEDTVLGK